MQIIRNIEKSDWVSVFSRPKDNDLEIRERVKNILSQIKEGGDEAIFTLSSKIERNGVNSANVLVTKEEFLEAETEVSDELKSALVVAKSNIEKFHIAQLRTDVEVDPMRGVELRQRRVPIERVGLYIPSGSAPLFSTVLMCAIPAKIAGCQEIVLCSPADSKGKIAPQILYAAQLCGIERVYKLGGAIAIGAMAYGCESLEAVDKIFGPGNRYVTYAKQMVSQDRVSIDMPAGPSEVMVVCDESSRSEFVAADLLSQLEHGVDSQAIAIVVTEELASNIASDLYDQAAKLERSQIVESALDNCKIIVESDVSRILQMVDYYAPEHLIVSLTDADNFAYRVRNAGSVFIGNYSPESVGDYASGTNHTLPTSAWSRSYSGVNVDSFSKYITYQKLSKEALVSLASCVVTMAEEEGLTAHRNAVLVRVNGCNM